MGGTVGQLDFFVFTVGVQSDDQNHSGYGSCTLRRLAPAHIRDMSNQDRSRQPAGVPTGGQFAAELRPEADVDLDSSPDVQPDVAYGFYEPGSDVFSSPVAYQWEDHIYTPDGLIEAMIARHRASPAARNMNVEVVLDQIAEAEAIDREDEYSFDTDEFPKTVTHDQLVADQTLEVIGSDGVTPVLYGEPWVSSNDIADGQEAAVEALVWQATGDDGEPLDADIELNEDSLDTLNEQFDDFVELNPVLVKRATATVDMAQLGHSWVLSRNGHGTGLWDVGLGPVGDKLHKAAQDQGPLDSYVGDDGRLHLA